MSFSFVTDATTEMISVGTQIAATSIIGMIFDLPARPSPYAPLALSTNSARRTARALWRSPS